MTGFGYNVNGFGAGGKPFVADPGQQVFTSSGTWTCPVGVTSISVVAVGGGGGGPNDSGALGKSGGAGGGTGWINGLAVTPGTDYSIVVGAGGARSLNNATAGSGGDSYFVNATDYVTGKGGTYIVGGGYVGDDGTDGQDTSPEAGGGQYTFTQSGVTMETGARGGQDYYFAEPGGGGVGLDGGTGGAGNDGSGSQGGTGGNYGGGGGVGNQGGGGNGGPGAVRIVWGEGRAYPDTNASDV